VLEFKYLVPETDPDEWKDASRIVAYKGSLKLEILRAGDSLFYFVENPQGKPGRKSCSVRPLAQYNSEKIPTELFEMEFDSLGHGTSEDPVEKVRIETEY
jgi:hypothetical protein